MTGNAQRIQCATSRSAGQHEIGLYPLRSLAKRVRYCFSDIARTRRNAYTCPMDGVTYYSCGPTGPEIVVAEGTARRYPPHFHTEHRVAGEVLFGTVVVETPEETRTFGEGDRFEIPAGGVHAVSILAGGALKTVCVPEEAPVPATDSCVAAVAARIMARPGEPFSLADMAALAGYSPWHFLRSFRAATGMTPHAFQLVCMVRLARQLLRNDKAAAEAAALAGFADQSHMHKVFCKHHGLTPKQFLKRNVPFIP